MIDFNHLHVTVNSFTAPHISRHPAQCFVISPASAPSALVTYEQRVSLSRRAVTSRLQSVEIDDLSFVVMFDRSMQQTSKVDVLHVPYTLEWIVWIWCDIQLEASVAVFKSRGSAGEKRCATGTTCTRQNVKASEQPKDWWHTYKEESRDETQTTSPAEWWTWQYQVTDDEDVPRRHDTNISRKIWRVWRRTRPTPRR